MTVSSSLSTVNPLLIFTKRFFACICLFFAVSNGILLFSYFHSSKCLSDIYPSFIKWKPSTPEVTIASQSPRWVNQTRERYLIYRCEGKIGKVYCSGWGNRLIGIVASYILANATNRTFGIRMNMPCNLTDYLIPNTYNWYVPVKKLKGRSSIAMHLRNNRSFTNSLQTLNFNKQFPQDVIYIVNNHDYHWVLLRNKLYKGRLRWLKGRPTALVYKMILDMLFKLNPNMQGQLDSFLGRAKKDGKRRLVCAQIRLGRNPTIPLDNLGTNTLKDVEQIWQFIRQHNSSWIFVTTDSEEVRKWAKLLFGKNVLDTEGEIIHMDKAYKGDVCRGMNKAILDQWILINCDFIVISTSSFGRIPVFIRGTPFGLYLFTKNAVTPYNPF